MNRRDMQCSVSWVWAAVVIGLLSGTMLISACGGGGTSTSPNPSGASEAPKNGGSITMAYSTDPNTLDPAIAWNIIDWQIEHDVFQSLYGHKATSGNAGTEIVPELAAAMPEISQDGKTFTIRIREGVKFQPPVNREVTADDFKYSFERMMKEPLAPGTYFYTNVVGASDYMAGKAKDISGFKVVDPHTLQIDLETPDLAFVETMTMQFVDVVAKEWVEKWGKKIGRHPLGTGPFMFDHWTSGQEIVLKKNPNYWEDGKPYLDEVVFLLSVNPQNAFLKLQLGEVDLLGDYLPPAEVVRTKADPAWSENVISTPMIATQYLFLNTKMKPLDNVTVRQAISWAINREKLVKLIAGQGVPLYQFYPPGMPGHVEGKKYYGYDPDKAKQLLAEAGFPDGISGLTLYSTNGDPYPKLMQSIQADLSTIGIKAEVKLMTDATYYSLASTPNKATMGGWSWYMDFPDPFDWVALYSKSNAVEGGMNVSYWWSQTTEDLTAEAQASTDAAARIAKYEEVQAAIMEEAPYVTLYAPVVTTMFSKNVGGFYWSLVYGYDPANYWRK